MNLTLLSVKAILQISRLVLNYWSRDARGVRLKDKMCVPDGFVNSCCVKTNLMKSTQDIFITYQKSSGTDVI